MSYTSKYTGEEIDNLLSSIKENRSNIKTDILFEGKGLPSTTVQLNGQLEDYDFVFFQTALTSSDGTLAVANSKSIYIKDHMDKNSDRSIYGTIGLPISFDTTRELVGDNWASLRITVKNQTIVIGTVLCGKYTDYTGYLQRVIGIKLSQAITSASTSQI